MGRLRPVLALAAVAVAWSVAACTSASTPAGPASRSPGQTCRWPAAASTSPFVRAGDTLYALDPASGRELGHCVGHGLVEGTPVFTRNGEQWVTGYSPYVRPPIAGRASAMPDNGSGSAGHGGVRNLRTGVRRALSFSGWTVVTVAGSRLLLARTGAEGTGNPADWCVLPSADARRSSCRRVDAATVAGTPSIGLDGTISWIPYLGIQQRIGRLPAYLATDGRVITGCGARKPEDHIPFVPVGMDQHTAVFPVDFFDGPTTRSTLQWATIAGSSGRLRVTLHDSGVTDDRHGLTEPNGGVQGSADGTRVALLDAAARQVSVVTESGTVHTVRLGLPRGSGRPRLVRWVFR